MRLRAGILKYDVQNHALCAKTNSLAE